MPSPRLATTTEPTPPRTRRDPIQKAIDALEKRVEAVDARKRRAIAKVQAKYNAELDALHAQIAGLHKMQRGGEDGAEE